jgi:hypothetical protein
VKIGGEILAIGRKNFEENYSYLLGGELASAEVTRWQGHPADEVQAVRDHLALLKDQGINSLNDQ